MAIIYGDMAGTLLGKARGQILVGIDEERNTVYGDAETMTDSRGGNDVLIGGKGYFNNVLYGDAEEMTDSRGGNDVLIGGKDNRNNFLYGDAETMTNSRGGNDAVKGGDNSAQNYLFGDAGDMFDNGRGGNDLLIGGVNSSLNNLYGDAYFMSSSKGGNDVLIGGALSINNRLYGDAYVMSGGQGGNDVLTGGSSSLSNILYGDAYSLSGGQGGNDVLISGSDSEFNVLFGDAYGLSDSRGGNDILTASDNPISGAFVTKNSLYGDAEFHSAGNVICGNDRLISGTANDAMWGDIVGSGLGSSTIDLMRVTTGQDVFVFSTNNGNDTIHDFRHGEDKIELKGIGVANFGALMSHLQSGETNTVITFGSNTITVIGVTELTAADFLFT